MKIEDDDLQKTWVISITHPWATTIESLEFGRDATYAIFKHLIECLVIIMIDNIFVYIHTTHVLSPKE
jgi:hypothetical protein